MPQISVILPNYNHVQYLQQRIESILNQSYQDFELILLDDCSTDNSREILITYENHPKVSHCVFNDTNSGSTFLQWKKGVELAKGEYIWIAESDDWAEPELLKTLTELLDEYPRVGLAYCNSQIYQDEKLIGDFAKIKAEKFGIPHWEQNYVISGIKEIEQVLIRNCTINNVSAVLFRKSVLNEILPSLISFRYSGDWFCYLQVAAVSDIAYSALPLNNYRDHLKNISKQAGYSYIKELFIIYSWLFEKHIPSNRKLLMKAMHLYVSDVYSTGLKWNIKRDIKELYPLQPYLYFNMTMRLLRRKIRRIFIKY